MTTKTATMPRDAGDRLPHPGLGHELCRPLTTVAAKRIRDAAMLIVI